jgi:hypothetical protein
MHGFERIRHTFRQHPRRRPGERRAPLRVLPLAGSLLAILLLISACGKVPMPDSDATSPNLSWQVMDGLNGSIIHTAPGSPGGEYVGTAPDMVAVILTADDSEGVKRITLSEPQMTYTCTVVDSGLSTTIGPGSRKPAPPQQVTPAPDSQGHVYDHLMLLDTVYFTFNCGDGLELTSATATIIGEAENFFGGIETSTLVLTHTP